MSVSTRRGRRRGLPGPWCARRIASSTGIIMGQSATCPALRTQASIPQPARIPSTTRPDTLPGRGRQTRRPPCDGRPEDLATLTHISTTPQRLCPPHGGTRSHQPFPIDSHDDNPCERSSGSIACAHPLYALTSDRPHHPGLGRQQQEETPPFPVCGAPRR